MTTDFRCLIGVDVRATYLVMGEDGSSGAFK